MNYKSIEELSVTYLEAIGFKHNDHVCVLFKNGNVQHGKLNFHGTFIKLNPTENIVISMFNAIALYHVNFIKLQPHLYDIVDNYKVTFKTLNINHKLILGHTPRQIFNQMKLLKPYCYLNMDIDIVNKTIEISRCTFENKLNI